jgi:hypothetical protein
MDKDQCRTILAALTTEYTLDIFLVATQRKRLPTSDIFGLRHATASFTKRDKHLIPQTA